LKIKLDGISQGVRAFTDEMRIRLFAVENSLSQNIPSILVPLRDPGIQVLTLEASAPVIEPKMAARAEILAVS
jgi:hypothetical protein